MLAIFFYLTSFFDLQEWVPTGDKKIKKNKKKKEKKDRVPLCETKRQKRTQLYEK